MEGFLGMMGATTMLMATVLLYVGGVGVALKFFDRIRLSTSSSTGPDTQEMEVSV